MSAVLYAMLSHHVRRAEAGVRYNALANCHSRDMHSIVLHDEPGNRVRMFYAEVGHALWQNQPGYRFSIAIHPHHCDLQFIGLFGPVFNEVYALTPSARGDFEKMRFRSGITDSKAAMQPTGERAHAHRISREALFENPRLRAEELHTIYIGTGQEAAWLVIEGAEDPAYEPVCWTNETLPRLEGLYQPLEGERLVSMLRRIAKLTESGGC
jgi:hypothetical protein